MKTFFTLAILLAFGSISFSQEFVYSTDQNIDSSSYWPAVGIYDINFTTPMDEAITYEWLKIEESMPFGWDYSLCDYNSCYISLPGMGTMLPISLAESQGGLEGFFKLNLDPVGTYGEGFLKLYVYDSLDVTRGDTVSFHIVFEDSTASITQLNQDEFKMFPNPATNEVIITAANDSKPFSTIIYNIAGAVVYQENKTEVISQKKIDLRFLESGVYFVALKSEDGSISKQKLIIE